MFEQDLEALADIEDKFGRLVPNVGTNEWARPTPGAFTLTNRLFTPVESIGSQEPLKLKHAIDPTGELAVTAGLMGLIHTDDNNVDFFEQRGTTL